MTFTKAETYMVNKHVKRFNIGGWCGKENSKTQQNMFFFTQLTGIWNSWKCQAFREDVAFKSSCALLVEVWISGVWYWTFPYPWSISFCPREILVPRGVLFTTASFTIAKHWNNPKCPPMGVWASKL